MNARLAEMEIATLLQQAEEEKLKLYQGYASRKDCENKIIFLQKILCKIDALSNKEIFSYHQKRICSEIGGLQSMLGRFVQAMETFQPALTGTPEDFVIHSQLAEGHLVLMDYAKAREQCKKAKMCIAEIKATREFSAVIDICNLTNQQLEARLLLLQDASKHSKTVLDSCHETLCSIETVVEKLVLEERSKDFFADDMRLQLRTFKVLIYFPEQHSDILVRVNDLLKIIATHKGIEVKDKIDLYEIQAYIYFCQKEYALAKSSCEHLIRIYRKVSEYNVDLYNFPTISYNNTSNLYASILLMEGNAKEASNYFAEDNIGGEGEWTKLLHLNNESYMPAKVGKACAAYLLKGVNAGEFVNQVRQFMSSMDQLKRSHEIQARLIIALANLKVNQEETLLFFAARTFEFSLLLLMLDKNHEKFSLEYCSTLDVNKKNPQGFAVWQIIEEALKSRREPFSKNMQKNFNKIKLICHPENNKLNGENTMKTRASKVKHEDEESKHSGSQEIIQMLQQTIQTLRKELSDVTTMAAQHDQEAQIKIEELTSELSEVEETLSKERKQGEETAKIIAQQEISTQKKLQEVTLKLATTEEILRKEHQESDETAKTIAQRDIAAQKKIQELINKVSKSDELLRKEHEESTEAIRKIALRDIAAQKKISELTDRLLDSEKALFQANSIIKLMSAAALKSQNELDVALVGKKHADEKIMELMMRINQLEAVVEKQNSVPELSSYLPVYPVAQATQAGVTYSYLQYAPYTYLQPQSLQSEVATMEQPTVASYYACGCFGEDATCNTHGHAKSTETEQKHSSGTQKSTVPLMSPSNHTLFPSVPQIKKISNVAPLPAARLELGSTK